MSTSCPKRDGFPDTAAIERRRSEALRPRGLTTFSLRCRPVKLAAVRERPPESSPVPLLVACYELAGIELHLPLTPKS